MHVDLTSLEHYPVMPKSPARFTMALLFITGLLCATLHAAEYGPELHYHGDAACVFTLPEEEYDSLVPSRVREPFLRSLSYVSAKPRSKLTTHSILALHPPINGPPLFG